MQVSRGQRFFCCLLTYRKRPGQCLHMLKWKWKSLSRVQLFVTPWTWNSPGQNTGVGSLSLLQGIFPTQGSNPGLPHCGRILYHLSHKGSPILFLFTLLLQYGLAFSGTHQACSVFEPLLGSILHFLQIHFSITSSGTLLLTTLSKVLSETACFCFFFSPLLKMQSSLT